MNLKQTLNHSILISPARVFEHLRSLWGPANLADYRRVGANAQQPLWGK